ncbi:SHD1 domain-containing protein [Botrimarina mediterranea]|uniref:SLA1 homology domain-containing protein n=1 Tax=Botrimarina mediterranea TaxID=2528022 RepID=A0A518K875_9BACT|nr:SHD1 domain-containing protein [Botrimarina mediterranea]QDV73993.1 hypothetical protein Spa11_21920 [Botrimarina mediterranea]QDV78623.1 hypothetical protein K2D_22300 [Planctomycetes bacterium K2D]
MTIRPLAFLVAACLLFVGATSCDARTWSDSSGQYTVDAELVALTEKAAILQRGDHHLVSIDVEQLSEEDQAYLATEEAKLAADRVANKQQTWTTVGGIEIIGNVVDFVERDVTFQRRRSKVYVNDRVFDNLPDVYQKIAPRVVAHFENLPTINDKASLERWLVRRRGQPATYKVEGVILELPSGDEYAFPFFLFRDEDLEVLKPGWDRWVAAHGNYESQSSMSDELRTLAAARQQDAEVTQQIAKLQLMMQTVEAGVTSLWEVTLMPGQGVAGTPLWVVVPGRDSRQATAAALSRNPGYIAGPVRRVSR